MTNDIKSKTCFFTNGDHGYKWHKEKTESNSEVCIMTKALDLKAIMLDELDVLVYEGKITDKELTSIRRFDGECGNNTDLKNIKNIGKRFNTELVKLST